MTVLLISVAVLLGLNLVMVSWAFGEWVWARTRKASWRTAGQVLPPAAEPRQPTIIMVHGFGGSPLDLKPLAETLRDRGFKVVVPVVPGQIAAVFAYCRHRFSADRYLDWLENILAAETRHRGQRPFLVGFSMGATLATIMAARGLSPRVVLLAPYYRLALADGLMAASAAVARYLVPVVPRLIKVGINDPEGRRIYRPGTHLVCLRGFQHLRTLAECAEKQIVKIEVPILVMTATQDSVADSNSVHQLFQTLPSASVEQCGRSNHALLYDADHQWVIERVVRFIETPRDAS